MLKYPLFYFLQKPKIKISILHNTNYSQYYYTDYQYELKSYNIILSYFSGPEDYSIRFLFFTPVTIVFLSIWSQLSEGLS